MNDDRPSCGGALFLALFIFGYGLVQTVAGVYGLAFLIGWGWAIGVSAVSIIFRFSLPFTVGAFVTAWRVWEWHWALATLFAAPGLIFMAVMGPMEVFFRPRTPREELNYKLNRMLRDHQRAERNQRQNDE